MSFDNLIQWVKNPALLDRDSLTQLRGLVDEYPCFTVARILYLKNLLVLNDQRFSKELILTAISVPDRRRLYYFVEDKPMPESDLAHEKELSDGEGFSIIDRFLHLTAADNASVEKPLNVDSNEELDNQEKYQQTSDENVEPSLTFDLPQEESNFSLDYVSYLNQSAPDAEDYSLSMPGQDLIDAFLEDSPEGETKKGRIRNVKSDKPEKEDVSVEMENDVSDGNNSNVVLPEETFTETLAKIYLKQKRYDHALEIFKSLSLKYPEKNVYFADQIRFLEKLIINIKNN